MRPDLKKIEDILDYKQTRLVVPYHVAEGVSTLLGMATSVKGNVLRMRTEGGGQPFYSLRVDRCIGFYLVNDEDVRRWASLEIGWKIEKVHHGLREAYSQSLREGFQ